MTADESCSAGEIRSAVKARYAAVAERPEGHFPYPVGRESARGLGYRAEWLASVPALVVERFVGAGNPFSLRAPRPGESVLDVGCGCGFDTFVAASAVGPRGRAVGIDLTREMLAVGSACAQTLTRPSFVAASVEALPFAAASFDLVISNGVLNLVPDKDAAFREISRVLRPGGTFAAADILVTETVPDEVLASADAWSA